MIEAVIIDDEAKSREVLQDMLTRFCPDVKLVGQSDNAEEAIQLITETKPKLAFLDINMPNGSGFDLLKAFPKVNFQVVFITAHNEHAIEAIKASALDFLLKPINVTELKQSVHRALQKLSHEEEHNHLHLLVDRLSQSQKDRMKIAIPTAMGLQFVDIEKIVRLEADGNYTKLFFEKDKSVLSTKNLKEYEDQLPHSLFFRTHHSHLVNLRHVLEYYRGEGGSLKMVDQSQVPVAKRRKKSFLEQFQV
jgi:two-component system LytT family response regulator